MYVALGDSMSIDYYPQLDAEERDWTSRGGLGASSLLYRNEDEVWPEFKGLDLVSRYPGVQRVEYAVDGALIGNVQTQLAQAPEVDADLVTLTVGGNDLLASLYSFGRGGMTAMAAAVEEVRLNYSRLIEEIRGRFPRAVLVLTTIYDPTDGTGRLPGDTERLPIEFLKQMNAHIRATGAGTDNAVVADVCAHFMGHGRQAPSAAEFWYYSAGPIEPSARGASEIRRVWWETLTADS